MAMKTKRTTEYIAMNPRYCMACGECVKKCPKKVIGQAGFPWHRHVVFKHAEACIGCGKCIKTCPNGVFFKPGEPVPARKAPTGMSFRIEQLLPVVFLASAVTGIGLHAAGHGTDHEIWHNWSIAHITASLLWLLAVAAHIKRHKSWYKSLLSKGMSRKRLITFFLSVLFLMAFSTGVLLIACVTGANTPLGLWHYKLGLVLIVLSLIHIFHRQ